MYTKIENNMHFMSNIYLYIYIIYILYIYIIIIYINFSVIKPANLHPYHRHSQLSIQFMTGTLVALRQ